MAKTAAADGLTISQIQTVGTTITGRRLPPHTARPGSMPLVVRVLLVLIHLRTNLTTRALAALFGTSQSTVALSARAAATAPRPRWSAHR
jgi:Helix-turn-helix of DDE superfamily endonuclease